MKSKSLEYGSVESTIAKCAFVWGHRQVTSDPHMYGR